MINPYTPTIEKSMKAHYEKLNEKDQRSYLAVEALKLGLGGKKYITKTFKCSPNRIARGIEELDQKKSERIRLMGGGRTKILKKTPELLELFDTVIKSYTAGSPVDSTITWTNLSRPDIVEKIKTDHGYETSIYMIDKMMIERKMKKRKLHKGKTLKSVPERNEQFENIEYLRKKAEGEGNPTISVDTKKKSC